MGPEGSGRIPGVEPPRSPVEDFLGAWSPTDPTLWRIARAWLHGGSPTEDVERLAAASQVVLVLERDGRARLSVAGPMSVRSSVGVWKRDWRSLRIDGVVLEGRPGAPASPVAASLDRGQLLLRQGGASHTWRRVAAGADSPTASPAPGPALPSSQDAAASCKDFYERRSRYAGKAVMTAVHKVHLERRDSTHAVAHVDFGWATLGKRPNRGREDRAFSLEWRGTVWLVTEMQAAGTGRFPE
jgi:hypothetical protein